MIEQEITLADQLISGNGRKRGRPAERNLTEYSKRKMRKAGQREEDMDASGEWRRLFLLRDAHPQIIAELLDSSDDEDKKNKESIDFARELLRKGLISEDTTSWRFLILHYRNNKRKFPASFFDMLRLEVFYKGLQEARRGDLALLNLYRDTGYMIDSGFDTNLTGEEDYVASLIDEKPAGMSEDSFGYYREDEYGRWRQPVASGDSGIIADSSMHSISREIMRNFEPQQVR